MNGMRLLAALARGLLIALSAPARRFSPDGR
jgi:hypothetical protein